MQIIKPCRQTLQGGKNACKKKMLVFDINILLYKQYNKKAGVILLSNIIQLRLF